MSKETIYDEQIAPLMGEIITICKEHKINMAAQFSLGLPEDSDQTLYCTTTLPIDETDEDGYKHVNQLREVMKPRAMFAAFTIVSK